VVFVTINNLKIHNPGLISEPVNQNKRIDSQFESPHKKLRKSNSTVLIKLIEIEEILVKLINLGI